jgi:hypothetical protein
MINNPKFKEPEKNQFLGFIEQIRKNYIITRIWLTEDAYSDAPVYISLSIIPSDQHPLIKEGVYIRVSIIKEKYRKVKFEFNIYPPWTSEELEEANKHAEELYKWLKHD